MVGAELQVMVGAVGVLVRALVGEKNFVSVLVFFNFGMPTWRLRVRKGRFPRKKYDKANLNLLELNAKSALS